MSTTTDLSKFTHHELGIAGKLLTLYTDHGCSYHEYMGTKLHIMKNVDPSYVFLTDENLNVLMINDNGILEPWIVTPHGQEGFVSELLDDFSPDELHRQDAEYLRKLANWTGIELPDTWTKNEEED